jgi:Tfp pilus assembly protein PilN
MIERIEVNLLPAEYRVRKRAIRIHREVFYPIVIAGVLGIIVWALTLSTDNDIRSKKNDIQMLDLKIEQNKHIEKEINSLAADKKVIVEKIMALERINVNRAKWVRLMEMFCRCLPDYTWIVDIAETDSVANSLAVDGRTYSFPEVATYMTKLKASPYITSVDLRNIEQIDEKNRIFQFKFVCAVDPNAGLGDLMETDSLAGRKPAPTPPRM